MSNSQTLLVFACLYCTSPTFAWIERCFIQFYFLFIEGCKIVLVRSHTRKAGYAADSNRFLSI